MKKARLIEEQIPGGLKVGTQREREAMWLNGSGQHKSKSDALEVPETRLQPRPAMKPAIS